MRGMPYVVRLMAGLPRPKASARKLGADMAGSAEAVGKNVTSFRPGNEVFGGLDERGTLAEYITIRADGPVLPKRASLTFEHAAGGPGCLARAPRHREGRPRHRQDISVHPDCGRNPLPRRRTRLAERSSLASKPGAARPAGCGGS